MNKVILIGAGGHSKVIQDIIHAMDNFQLYAVLDDAIEDEVEKSGIIYANPRYLNNLNISKYLFCISIGNNKIREKIFKRFNIPMELYTTLIHPTAVISPTVKIGCGSVIMANAVINADTYVGNHCIINTNSVVEHDNVLSDYVHISPSATLSGTVKVNEGVHIGSGAIVIPGKSIGRWSTVGAGAVVVNDIIDNITVVGVPARGIK